jgi:hypothetical protein
MFEENGRRRQAEVTGIDSKLVTVFSGDVEGPRSDRAAGFEDAKVL